jgi:ATP-binding cassette, subfamily B, bacterial PglK
VSLFLDIWQLLDHRQRRALVALQLLALLMAASTTVGIAAILPFFAMLTDPASIERLPGLRELYELLKPASRHDFVLALGVVFAAAVVAGNAVNLVGSYAMNRFAFGVGDTLHVALFDEYLRRDYAFHVTNHGAELSHKVINETGRVVSGILQNGLMLISNLVTIASIAICAALVDPVVAAGAGAALGGSYMMVYLAARGRLRRNGMEESRCYAARSKLVAESFASIKEIIVARAQATLVDGFTQFCEAISRTIVSTLSIAQSPRYGLESAAACILVAVGIYLSGQADQGVPQLARLSFIGLAAYRLLPATQQAFAAIARVRADRPAFENVAADLKRSRLARRRPRSAALDGAWLGRRPRHEIRLDAVSYWHASRERPALCDATLTIRAGSVVGFVGANGSGKTTLVDLIAGLLMPQTGRVLIDEIALDAANRDSWLTTLAYVSQHTCVLDATVAQNVALGVPAAQVDHARLCDSLRVVGLEPYIGALPDGRETLLGERGARLSGGQRQRLGIARALYREASVLIMDEATSGLDPAAEQAIVDAVAARARDRTVIIVAHRLPALQHCEEIFELQGGRISRRTSYLELRAGATTGATGHAPAARGQPPQSAVT